MERNAAERLRPSIPTGSNIYMVMVTAYYNSGQIEINIMGSGYLETT